MSILSLFIQRSPETVFSYPAYQYDNDSAAFFTRSDSVPENKHPAPRKPGGASTTNIINDYTPVIAYEICTNTLTVEDGTAFNTGDTVLLIQMKGAEIDSTNTASFGTITSYKSAGNYEYNYVKNRTGNNIVLKNKLLRSYEIPAGKVQLVRVPSFANYTVTDTLTCLPWDGAKGGILAMTVTGTLTLNGDIDVSSKGFRGGDYEQKVSDCSAPDYVYPSGSTSAALKGEGIAWLSNNLVRGKGKAANAGGSGNDHNSGGAGGANNGNGGNGGKEFSSGFCPGINNGGIGGAQLSYNNTTNKVFMGGGGGAGDINGILGGFKGGNGGGIVILDVVTLDGNNKKISSRGETALDCLTNDCWESGSGGGAGGTILINTNNYINPITINTSGGNGGSLSNTNGNGYSAPGGGGGGGTLWIKGASLPGTINYLAAGGQNGLFVALNQTGGATAGTNGGSVTGLSLPVTSTLFKPNIDSARFNYSSSSCSDFQFSGLAYTNTSAISGWQWYFGDGGTATTQNSSHSYSTSGNYTVKLVVTDVNGCKDSILKPLTVLRPSLDAGPDKTICPSGSVVLQATESGTTSLQWTPAAPLNNSTLLNPVAAPSVTTWFYLTATAPSGCTVRDSVLVTVRSLNSFSINPATGICKNSSAQLTASGGDLYAWSPGATLNNPAISNPVATPATTTQYSVEIKDTVCNNIDTLYTTITILPLPVIIASRSNDIDCIFSTSLLSASGAVSYLWSPASTLSNPSLASPLATPVSTTTYTVTGTDHNGCRNTASTTVVVSQNNKSGYFIPNAFTPDNDGINDCFGIKNWGAITELEFSVYNRWGERIFFTKNPGDCWNGIYKTIPQPPGIYIYQIKAKTTCQSQVYKKGTFALIR